MENSFGKRSKQTAEICIIGGGIYGIVIAYHLLLSGRDVLIVDRGPIGMEASRANAGSLGVQNKPVKMLSHMVKAAHRWEILSDKLGHDVGYERLGGFRIAHTEEDVAALQMRLPEQKAAGVPLELVTGKELRKEAPYLADSVRAAAYCFLDGKADPFKTVFAYSKAVKQRGGRFLTHSPVKQVRHEGGHILVKTTQTTISAEKVVNAAGAWAAAVSVMMGTFLPVSWVVNSVSVTEPGPLVFPHLITHIRGNLTLKQVDGRILIGGAWRGDGDPYGGRKQVNLENLKGNIDWACQAIPAIKKFRILRSWVGFQGQSPDRLFMLGELPPFDGRQYAMVGGSGGFSLAPVYGELMAEWIHSGNIPRNVAIYDVRRYCKQ